MSSWKRTLADLLAGIVLTGLLFEGLGLIFAKDRIYHSVGMLCGVLIAAGMAIHMAVSLNNALDWEADFARRSIMKSFALRYAVVAVLMGLVAYFRIGNLISCFAGMMTLKVSAYLQPSLHKFCNKYILKIEEEGGCKDAIVDDDIEDDISEWLSECGLYDPWTD